MKIKFGSGDRPTPGFLSSDVNLSKNVDFVGNPWEIDIADNSGDTFLALAVMEHLTYEQVRKTIAFTNQKLKVGGEFFFDVPDIVVWCEYLTSIYQGKGAPFSEEHVWSTLYGWQRWDGDEHKSGWSEKKIIEEIKKFEWAGFQLGVEQFIENGFERRRMGRPADAHVYVRLTR